MQVFDLPINSVLANKLNPNEQDDDTFDLLVEKIRENGFDEPVIVVPTTDGNYEIVSGHHRVKAAKVLKYDSVPCIIHRDWDDDKKTTELVARNQLRGKVNPEKFAKIVNEMKSRGIDTKILQKNMGFTKSDAFDKMLDSVSKNLPAKQKKQLEEAKENIKSVDDLSSVLNTIFRNHGSELDKGFMVFSFGGKNHHYFQIDKEMDIVLKKLEESCVNTDITVCNYLKNILKKEFSITK